MNIVKNTFKRVAATAVLGVFTTSAAMAALVTDPDDPRSWQGANVGTFATLYYGGNTLANRQLVVDTANGGVNSLLDDGLFDPTGSTGAAMIRNINSTSTGRSTDSTGTGSFAYTTPAGDGITAGSSIDNLWVQTYTQTIGDAVWDLGGPSTKAAIFNTIDHGPLPQEAIESTVYLSNDINFGVYEEAVTERVWLEGYEPILGIKWDGFAYAVGTASGIPFRYASIIWGGPGALISDGDNEINGVLGLDSDFTPIPPISGVPVPAAVWLVGTALIGFIGFSRRTKVG
jgi:hypothetical protein